ncbi:glycosyltransferase [Blautia schinkii]|nr:glycosyltransferase [Blautia schinkii]
MSKLSVVLPAYNEELMVGKACRVLREILSKAGITYELVLVNDGSRDNTWEEIVKAGKKDKNILGVHFSRNFGKESAVFAGMAQATGDVIAVMDCDLQHPPETLVEMYHLWEQGYEVIEGVKKSRGKEGFLHKKSAGFFYGIMSKATKVDMQNASDFKMMDRKAVESILAMPERNMFFRATSSWVGFKTTYVKFEVQEREAGESKWSAWSLVKYAFTNIVAFTTLPLQFVTVGGVLCFIGSLVLIIYSLVQYFSGKAVAGYTTTIMVILLIGSAMMMSLGIIGYYIAKIYEEVKRRPRYIVSKIIRGSEDISNEARHDGV